MNPSDFKHQDQMETVITDWLKEMG